MDLQIEGFLLSYMDSRNTICFHIQAMKLVYVPYYLYIGLKFYGSVNS